MNVSSYECLECEYKYYLNDNTCVQRVNMNYNCLDYEVSHDGCKSCLRNHYFGDDDDQYKCIPYEPNCRFYVGKDCKIFINDNFTLNNFNSENDKFTSSVLTMEGYRAMTKIADPLPLFAGYIRHCIESHSCF